MNRKRKQLNLNLNYASHGPIIEVWFFKFESTYLKVDDKANCQRVVGVGCERCVVVGTHSLVVSDLECQSVIRNASPRNLGRDVARKTETDCGCIVVQYLIVAWRLGRAFLLLVGASNMADNYSVVAKTRAKDNNILLM